MKKLNFYGGLSKRFREAIVYTNASLHNKFVTWQDMKSYFTGITEAAIHELNVRIANIINNNPQPSEVVDARGAIKIFNDQGLFIPDVLRDSLEFYELGVYTAYVPFNELYNSVEARKAITNAISSTFSNGGGNVYIGKGEWVLDQQLIISDNISLILVNGASITFENGFTGSGIIVGSGSGLIGSSCGGSGGGNLISGVVGMTNLIATQNTSIGAKICGISLFGSSEINGILIDHSQTAEVSNCDFTNLDNGIFVSGSLSATIESCTMDSCNVGVNIDSNSHYTRVNQTTIIDSATKAINLESDSNQLYGLSLTGNALGVDFWGENNVITNSIIRDTVGNHIRINGTANNSTLTSSYLDGGLNKLIISPISEGVYLSAVFGSEGSQIISKGKMVLVNNSADTDILEIKRTLDDDYPLLSLTSTGLMRLGNGEFEPTTTLSGDADAFYVNGRLSITGTWDNPFYVNTKPVWIDSSGIMRTKLVGTPTNDTDGTKVADQ